MTARKLPVIADKIALPTKPAPPPARPVVIREPGKRPRLQLAKISSRPGFDDPLRGPPDDMHPWDEDAVEIAQAWVHDRLENHFEPPHYTGALNAKGQWKLKKGHNDHYGFQCQLSQALGSLSDGFHASVIRQLMNGPGVTTENALQALNDGLAFIASFEPANEIETMMLVQAWFAHTLTIQQMGRMGRADTLDQMTAHGDMAAKMGKMTARSLEAITKLRAGGEHRYAVTHTHNHNHLHVADGGQAIIGNNSTGGGGDLKIERQGHAPLALADASGLGLTVWGEDPERETVPRAGHEGQEAVSHARKRGRSIG